MKPLPLSVIGGYLGAGKTTLINRLLAADHGRRLMVLVNDFGAINIDAALLKSASEDTIELSNGCVCCTMSGDLYFTIGDILDRPNRPDHLIVEASGIADPAKIAAVAIAEKDLRYSGILTVVDGMTFPKTHADQRIAPQLLAQIQCADVIAISKTSTLDPSVTAAFQQAQVTHWIDANDMEAVPQILFEPSFENTRVAMPPTTHPQYVSWSSQSVFKMSKPALDALIARAPDTVLRLKAVIPNTSGGYLEAHVVGDLREVSIRSAAGTLGIVAIGLQTDLDPGSLDDWWHSGRQNPGA